MRLLGNNKWLQIELKILILNYLCVLFKQYCYLCKQYCYLLFHINLIYLNKMSKYIIVIYNPSHFSYIVMLVSKLLIGLVSHSFAEFP